MSTSISIRGRVARMIVLALVAGAMAPGAADARRPTGDGGNPNPNAVPAILAPATPAELRAIRLAEAAEAQRSAYRLPSTARYSDAETDAFRSEGVSRLELAPWHRADAFGRFA